MTIETLSWAVYILASGGTLLAIACAVLIVRVIAIERRLDRMGAVGGNPMAEAQSARGRGSFGP